MRRNLRTIPRCPDSPRLFEYFFYSFVNRMSRFGDTFDNVTLQMILWNILRRVQPLNSFLFCWFWSRTQLHSRIYLSSFRLFAFRVFLERKCETNTEFYEFRKEEARTRQTGISLVKKRMQEHLAGQKYNK